MQNMSKNNWISFKIVPQGHNNFQLSIVNCQFGEAAKFQFSVPQNDTERVRERTTTDQVRHDLAARPAGKFQFAALS